MKLFVKRHGIYLKAKTSLVVDLPDGATLNELISALNIIDGSDKAERANLDTIYIRKKKLIQHDTVLNEGDQIIELTPLREG